MTRPPQCRSDALVEHPTHRQVNSALAEALLSEPIELLHGGNIFCKPGVAEFWVGAPEIVAIESGIRPHSSRQQASAERTIAQCGNLVPAAIWQKVGLDFAFEQIVRRLQHVQWGDAAKTLHLKHGKVAHADGPDLPPLQ